MNRPLLWIGVFFTLGILVSRWSPFFFNPGNDIILCFIIVFALLASWLIKAPDRMIIALIFAGFFFLGLLRADITMFQERSRADLTKLDGREVTIKGHVYGFPEHREGMTVFLFKPSAPDFRGSLLKIFMNEIGEPLPLYWGDYLKISGKLMPPPRQRNPGCFDYSEYLSRRSVMLFMYSDRARVLELERSGSLASLVSRFRERIYKAGQMGLSKEQGALLLGIALGEERLLPAEKMDEFRVTGTLHVLAASGTNVGAVTAFLFLFLSWAGLKKKWSALLCLPFVFLYAAIANFSPSVMRAAIMSSAALLAVFFGREKEILSALFLAALALLFHNPMNIYDVGFQLSFLCVIAIFWLSEPVSKKLSFLPRWLALPVAITFSVQLLLTPVLAYYFHQFSLITVFANLVIVPLCVVVLITGMIQCLLGSIGMILAVPFIWVNKVMLSLIFVCVHLFSVIPGAFLWVIKPSWYFAVAYYGSLLLGFLALKGLYRDKKFAAALALVFIVAVSGWGMDCLASRSRMEWTFLEVGKGDASVLLLPGGRALLFDCGPPGKKPEFSPAARIIAPFLFNAGQNKIDVLFLSGSFPEYTGGLEKLADRIRIEKICLPESKPNYFTGMVEKIAKEKKIPLIRVTSGDEVDAGGGIKVKVLAPGKSGDADPQYRILILSVGIDSQEALISGEWNEEISQVAPGDGGPLFLRVGSDPLNKDSVSSIGYRWQDILVVGRDALNQNTFFRYWPVNEKGALILSRRGGVWEALDWKERPIPDFNPGQGRNF
ncbi:MAG: ComEC/Rec2 family competence protein [Chloroflexi bacterium]|nr:ComEC/Rec2 family competence protein [Chloroflexota bacterium]